MNNHNARLATALAVSTLLALAFAGCTATTPAPQAATTAPPTVAPEPPGEPEPEPAAPEPPAAEPAPAPAPEPPAPPRLESFNQTFNLTVSAPFVGRDGVAMQGTESCLFVRWPEGSPARILEGTYTATWDAQSPLAERMNLTVAPEGGEDDSQAAASPLNQSFAGIEGRALFALHLDTPGIAFQQEVRATLAFSYHGAAPTVLAAPCPQASDE